jgi:hypothetical protein
MADGQMEIPIQIRDSEVIATTFTPRLRLFSKSADSGLKKTELTGEAGQRTLVDMGTPLYLEADFEESDLMPSLETGFRECIAATDQDITNDRTILVRKVKKGKDPYLSANHQYNCIDTYFENDSRWKVHQAGSEIGTERKEALTKSLMEFPAFKVSSLSFCSETSFKTRETQTRRELSWGKAIQGQTDQQTN